MKNKEREYRATNHCCGRIEERMGITGEAAMRRLVDNAGRRGKTALDIKPGKERKYLERKSSEGITPIVYNDNCFIIKKDTRTCITMYPLPDWFGKKRFYDGKVQIRNVAKYSRMYGFNGCGISS